MAADGSLQPGILAKVVESLYSDGAAQVTPSGVLFIRVENVGSVTAKFNGINLAAGEKREYPFLGKGYDSMSYVTLGSTLHLTFII
jgi:hypothetical protein